MVQFIFSIELLPWPLSVVANHYFLCTSGQKHYILHSDTLDHTKLFQKGCHHLRVGGGGWGVRRLSVVDKKNNM